MRHESGVWSKPKKKYNSGKCKGQALLQALQKMKVWLQGVKFIVEMDAKTILHKLNLEIVDLPGAMVTLWILWIWLFNFTVRHVARRKPFGSDGL